MIVTLRDGRHITWSPENGFSAPKRYPLNRDEATAVITMLAQAFKIEGTISLDPLALSLAGVRSE